MKNRILFFLLCFICISYSSFGQNLAWAKKIGGTGDDRIYQLEIDGQENVYVIGSRGGGIIDMDPSANVLNFSGFGGFLSKFDKYGNFLWARNILCAEIFVDNSGNIYTTGSYNGTVIFDGDLSNTSYTSNGGTDIFVAKYNTNGNLINIITIGGKQNDGTTSIDVDSYGNIFITGSFQDTVDFDFGSGVKKIVSMGGSDIFMCKVNSNFTFGGADRIGTTLYSESSIKIRQKNGYVYLLGRFNGPMDFDPSPYSSTILTPATSGLNYVSDEYISKYYLSSSGASYQYAKQFGNTMFNSVRWYDLEVDNSGNSFLCGELNGTLDFDLSGSVYNLTTIGNSASDICFAKYTSSGTFGFAKNIGSGSIDFARDIELDNLGNIYISGSVCTVSLNSDLDPGSAVVPIITRYWYDLFVGKYSNTGNYISNIQTGSNISSSSFTQSNALAIGSSNVIYTGGHFQISTCLNPVGSVNTFSAGYIDCFLAKYVSCSLNINNISVSICQGDTYQLGIQNISTSGLYSMNLMGSNGCDSIINLSLTVNQPSFSNQTMSICEGYTYQFGSQILDSTGSYTEVFSNSNGCDSTVTLNLIIKPTSQLNLNEQICEGSTYQFGLLTLDSAGTYTQVLAGSNGCDSVVTLNLTLKPISQINLSEQICQGNTYQFGAQTLDSAGTYVQIFTSANGCDSIVTLNLTIKPVSQINLNEQICQGNTYQFGSLTLDSTGSYTQVFTSTDGCDSVVTINLQVNTVNTSVIQSGSMLMAVDSNATYQWVDCNNSYAPLIGDNAQSLYAPSNGSYGVIVNSNGCMDTSNCVVVVITNTKGYSLNQYSNFSIFPNPNHGSFKLNTGDFNANEVKVSNLLGEIVYQSYVNSNVIEISLTQMPKGMYLVNVSNGEEMRSQRVIIE